MFFMALRFQIIRLTVVRRSPIPMLLVLALALVPLPTAAAPTGTTRYVSNSGNDFGNGTCAFATPCATIQYAVAIAIGGDKISIATGEYDVFGVNVSKDLTFVGKGAGSTTVTANNNGNVFTIQSGVTAKIKKLLIRDGDATSPDAGGGIRNLGTLTVLKSTLMNNQAHSGGGIYNQGVLVLKRTQLNNNSATGTGGGLYNAAGRSAGLVKVNINNNGANSGGGAANYGLLSLSESAVYSNPTGGGIFNNSNLIVINSTISGNQDPIHAGSGIGMTGGNAHLLYTTVTGNGTSQKAGIFATTGSVLLSNSIVYGNGINPQCGSNNIGTFSDGGYNALADQSCSYVPGSGSIIANPKLKARAFNGGSTPTHALKANSPAIDLVPKSKCLDFDQRGVVRPIEGDGIGKIKCDAGSFEYQP